MEETNGIGGSSASTATAGSAAVTPAMVTVTMPASSTTTIPQFIFPSSSNSASASSSGASASASSSSNGQYYAVKSSPGSTPTHHHQQVDTSGFSFSDFLVQLEDYTPTLPDSVANHFLQLAGFESSDPRMSRLLSIVAQKYMCDVINDTFTHCKLRNPQPPAVGGNKTKVKPEKKFVLTMDDLIPVLNDYAITVRKPPYYA